MKTFLKMLLATILGGIILFFLFFFVLMGIAVNAGSRETKVEPGSYLHLELSGQVLDQHREDPFAELFPGESGTIGLNQWLEAIRHAADDERIGGIVIEPEFYDVPYASLRELRLALNRFRESGKKVYIHSKFYTEKTAYLATATDTSLIHPSGFVEWTGIHATVTYLKNTLNKIGVEPVVIRGRNNKFKSAVEPFLEDSISPANRLQLTALTSDIWNELLETVAERRGLDTDLLNRWAAELTLQHADEAVQLGFLDAMANDAEWRSKLQTLTLAGTDEDPNLIGPGDYLKTTASSSHKAPRVAVIYASGEMTLGTNSAGVMGAETIAKAIRKAREDERIKAVVLRVNSPGGWAIAADVINDELELCKRKKPVVVSMGDYAASGGYLISAGADSILAHPNTITGSIGVFGNFFVAPELLHETFGLNFSTVKTHPYADMGALHRPVADAEYSMLQRSVDRTYGDFLNYVAKGRGLDSSYVDSIGQGRVWTGKRAVELGLVDALGGLPEALEAAKKLAGIEEEIRVVELPEPVDPIEELLNALGNKSKVNLSEQLGAAGPYFEQWKTLTERPTGVYARMEELMRVE